MQFSCTQENLANGLTTVAHIAAKNTNLPILNNILVRAEKSGIALLATNLEIAITKRIRGKVEEEGQLTLPAKLFAEYVTLLPQETITVKQEATNILLACGGAETTIRGLAAEDFPLIPVVEQAAQYSCSAQALSTALSRVVFAAASDDTRPELNGVFLRCTGNTLTLAATDSFRLAEASVTLNENATQEQSAIVPVRALQEVVRMMTGDHDQVRISLTTNQIAVQYDDCELVSRLIDGQYPDYRQIIPTAHETKVTLPVQELQRAVRATSLFTRPGINDIILTFDATTQQATLEASNAQVGEHRRTIAATVEGKTNSIIFNSRYLIDGLASSESETVEFTMTATTAPGILRSTTTDDRWLYLIMPIRQ